MKNLGLGAVLSLLMMMALPARADQAIQHTFNPPGGVLLAQAESDDAFDPFADYSEYEQSIDEEEDINFFRNGRLLTMGFTGGLRNWTAQLQQSYSSAPAFGLFICYFFDLRFAMQFGFSTSDHSLFVKGTANSLPVKGTVSVTDLSFNLKYYMNTQNVTRGLADLNPYIIGGFSQVYRTTTVSGDDAFGRDASFGFNLGGGMEIPMMRNKMFFAAQATYNMVNFPDEGKTVIDENGVDSGIALKGDSYQILLILGVNF